MLRNINTYFRGEDAILPLKANYFMDDKHMRVKLDFFDAFVVGDTTFELFIKLLRVDGYPNYGDIDGMPFEVRPGYKHTFVVKPGVCGAFSGPNRTNFREFMCYNLGSNKDYKSHINTKGNLYAWGRRKIVVRGTTDSPYEKGTVWKKSENPCPTGYRVPTIGEWTDVLNKDYNDWEMVDDENCTWRIGRLFLTRDLNNTLWSSSGFFDYSREMAFSVVARCSNVIKFNSFRLIPNHVRCIKELPNE